MSHKVGRPRVNWTPEMDEAILQMRAAGVHKTEIAEKLGQSIAAVDARYFRLKKREGITQ